MYILLLTHCCFVLPSATPHGNNLYPYGPDQNDNEFGLDDFIYDSRCLEIRTDQLGFPFFSRRHYKLHVGNSGYLPNVSESILHFHFFE